MAGSKEQTKIDNLLGYEGLAIAIVRNAIQEYADAYKKVLIAEHFGKKSRIRNVDTYKFRMQEIESFFNGEWYQVLCNIDPSVLLKHAKEKGQKLFDGYVAAQEKAEERKKNQK